MSDNLKVCIKGYDQLSLVIVQKDVWRAPRLLFGFMVVLWGRLEIYSFFRHLRPLSYFVLGKRF